MFVECVNFCPNHPCGETSESLELERVALLTEVKNNEAVIKEKMQRSFSYRQQEVLQVPMIVEVRNRWPALFEFGEVSVLTHFQQMIPMRIAVCDVYHILVFSSFRSMQSLCV